MEKQNATTVRFIAAFRELEKGGNVKRLNEFCDQIEYRTTSFSQVLAGNRNVPREILDNFCKVFNVSRDYIYEGIEPIFNINKKTDESNQQKNDQKMNDIVELQRKLIEALLENSSLKDRVSKLEHGSLAKSKRSQEGK